MALTVLRYHLVLTSVFLLASQSFLTWDVMETTIVLLASSASAATVYSFLAIRMAYVLMVWSVSLDIATRSAILTTPTAALRALDV